MRANAAASQPEPVFPARAVVLHIGEGRPRGSTPSFPHDSGTLLERRFPVNGLPCAEQPERRFLDAALFRNRNQILLF